MIDRLRVPLQFDAQRLQDDLDKNAHDDCVAHFNTAYYAGDWSPLPLRSVGGGAR